MVLYRTFKNPKIPLHHSSNRASNIALCRFFLLTYSPIMHFSNCVFFINSDELPERLTLPDVLATASSLQNLVSLSLLGKSKIIIQN